MAQSNETKARDIKATIERDAEGRATGLVLTFSHGRVIALGASQLTVPVHMEAAIHGLKQKLVDAAAMSRSTETGKSATIEEKFAAVEKVYQRLLDGRWNEEREGGGSASYLLQALIKLYPARTEEDLREWLGKKTTAEKSAMESNPKIAPVIAEIKAAKAKNVDLEALDAELEALGSDEQ